MGNIQRLGSGERLSEAVVANGFVFLSGMVPEVASDNVTVQTADVLCQIDTWLAQAGSDKAHILEATIFLADMGDFAAVNEIYAAAFGEHKPARSTVQVAMLPKGALVEIEVIALARA